MAGRKKGTIAPRLDPIRLHGLEDGDPDALTASGHYEGRRYRSADLHGRNLAGAVFSECEFLDVSLHETDLRHASFLESTLTRIDAPVFAAPRVRLKDVVIGRSRLGSAELYDATLHSVQISDSKLGFVNLRGAELADVLITGCTIDELDLGEVTAERVSFPGTTINRLDVSGARLSHVDLRGVQLRSLTGATGLRGATLDPLQVTELAPLFAEHFGIIVES